MSYSRCNKMYFFLPWLRSFNPLRSNIRIHILHTFSLQDFFDNKELLKLVIVSFILITFTFDSIDNSLIIIISYY